MIAIKNDNKTAKGTALRLIQGSEFQRYHWIEDCLETSIYFCQPSSPYQKGSIENGNGVIRTMVSRKVDIDKFRQKDILRITAEINARPLRCLGYETPAERFVKLMTLAR